MTTAAAFAVATVVAAVPSASRRVAAARAAASTSGLGVAGVGILGEGRALRAVPAGAGFLTEPARTEPAARFRGGFAETERSLVRADDPLADECDDGPAEPAPEPPSACATPDPAARAAPIPSVIAPVPSHWQGSTRCGLR
ncbi:hypothetical protein [Mycolicibacterium vinylchloridicum]|uniref:hypothetical protein n=1 Tax=Mycolicibacterium vinylchloridicum TaxID=2736928 RepID=UPI0015CC5B3C|nr:hypothetical protein [Mycolicibacterium vinylchloridicum]